MRASQRFATEKIGLFFELDVARILCFPVAKFNSIGEKISVEAVVAGKHGQFCVDTHVIYGDAIALHRTESKNPRSQR
jgi:hypothetical protein